MFSSASGLSLNKVKSKIWFSPTVNSNIRNYFSITLDIPASNNLGKYLGFPLKPFYKSSNFDFILDNMKNKLQSLKKNTLSMAGRALLITTTTSVILSYFMSALSLP